MIRVLLAEGRPVVRVGLHEILKPEPDVRVIGEIADGDEVRVLTPKVSPDVLVLDPNLPGPPTPDVVDWLGEQCPAVGVLLLADAGSVADLHRVECSVGGYTCTCAPQTEIVQAIRTVAEGGTWQSQAVVDRGIVQAVEETLPALLPDAILTKRQREVLRLVAQGQMNKEIAYQLGIAERTVEDHIRKVMEKLEVSSRVDAAVWAKEYGLDV